MTATVRFGSAALALGVLSACGSGEYTPPPGIAMGGDCVSHYQPVVSAPTWKDLKDAMLGGLAMRGRVAASVQVVSAGGEVVARGDQDVVRVVDLLGPNGHRLAQAEVWRTDSGSWRAGVWGQCFD